MRRESIYSNFLLLNEDFFGSFLSFHLLLIEDLLLTFFNFPHGCEAICELFNAKLVEVLLSKLLFSLDVTL